MIHVADCVGYTKTQPSYTYATARHLQRQDLNASADSPQTMRLRNHYTLRSKDVLLYIRFTNYKTIPYEIWSVVWYNKQYFNYTSKDRTQSRIRQPHFYMQSFAKMKITAVVFFDAGCCK